MKKVSAKYNIVQSQQLKITIYVILFSDIFIISIKSSTLKFKVQKFSSFFLSVKDKHKCIHFCNITILGFSLSFYHLSK